MTTKRNGSTPKSARKESVKVSANELQSVVNSASAVGSVSSETPTSKTIGINVGVGHTSVGSPSSPSRPGRGRSDSASQFENAVIMENERTQTAKGSLRSAISAAFAAPSFDKDSFAADLLKSGNYSFTEIVEKVNAARKNFEASNPAPVCTYAAVCEWIRVNAVKLWSDYCPLLPVERLGINPSSAVVWSWTGLDTDKPTCTPLPADATNSDIITAVLSVYNYAVGIHAYNMRKQNAMVDAVKHIRLAISLLASADVVGDDIKKDLVEMVDVVTNEQKKLREQISQLTNEIADKEMEIALAGLLRSSAEVRLRAFYGGLSDYELSLVGLRGWSENRYNNLVHDNTLSIEQKQQEIEAIKAKLTA